jgi:outer membrane protein assembly factor BamB
MTTVARMHTAGLTRLWSLLLVVVLSMVTLTACKDAPDPACADGDDPPLMSVGDSGGPMCDPPEPDCEDCGGAWGDPHITTLDGLVYDLQAVGEFTMASLPGVEVQARFAPWGNSRTISVVTGVAISADGRTVSMTVDPATRALGVRVDGEEVDLSEDPVRLGEGLLGIAPGSDFVMGWPDGSLVAVTDNSGYLTLLVDAVDGAASSGLLGDTDGDKEDTFTTRDGTDLGVDLTDEQLYGEFAESWRITDQGSAFWYAEGTSTETFTDRTFPDEPVTLDSFSAEERAAAMIVCQDAGVTEGAVLDACILDVAATGDPSFAQAALAIQKRTNATALRASARLMPGDGTTWFTVLDGLHLAVTDLVHPSDSSQVYVLAEDAEGVELVVAIDASTGAEVWRVAGVVPTCGVGVLDDGRIAVVGRGDGPLAEDGVASLAVLDASTGDVEAATAWEGSAGYSVYCSPMVVSGDVVAVTNSQGAVKAWDVSEAPTAAWENTELERVSGSLVAVNNGLVLASEREGGGRQAVLFDTLTGAILDARPIMGRQQVGTGVSMVVSGDIVAISLVGDLEEADRLGTVTAFTVTRDALEPAWEFDVWNESAGKDPDHTFSSGLGAFSAGEGLLIGHAGNEITAIDALTGELEWRYIPRGFRWTGAAALIVNGVIWDGAFGGPLLSTVSTQGEFLREDLGDEVIVGWTRGATTQIFGPAMGDVVVLTSQDEEGNLLLLGLNADR